MKTFALALSLMLATGAAPAQHATQLVLSPWHGPALPTANPQAVHYQLTVHGRGGATVTLSTSGLAKGWIASFCTPRVCSPGHLQMTLPASGAESIEFQAIRDDDNAPQKTRVVITSDDGGVAALDVLAPGARVP